MRIGHIYLDVFSGSYVFILDLRVVDGRATVLYFKESEDPDEAGMIKFKDVGFDELEQLTLMSNMRFADRIVNLLLSYCSLYQWFINTSTTGLSLLEQDFPAAGDSLWDNEYKSPLEFILKESFTMKTEIKYRILDIIEERLKRIGE